MGDIDLSKLEIDDFPRETIPDEFGGLTSAMIDRWVSRIFGWRFDEVLARIFHGMYMVVFSKMGLPLNHPKLENFSIETIETYDFEDP